ncbi:methyltransferase [Streptomyces omiyaensis]|uniref:class I SAM-dependent methyltransferase n=1 Tax=Streptomyces omiyaensis TaxID=68247 RepID=UPI001674529A|nr:class I SAM-dependent methyltransferase [Streptomyces omiyaensis]GGY79045.1 methyltransferase [Streptomyces omiyaensis]
MTTFASAAHHYAAFRPHYPEEFFTLLVDRFGLDGTQTVLDLGCGPGTITIPLAARAGHVHAIDIEPAMIREGRKAAAVHGAGNITWACGDAAGLTGMGLPLLHLCTMGKSFQWMNQDQVLADLDTLIRDGGGVVLVSTGPRASAPRPAWLDIIDRVCTDVIGPGYRQEHGPAAHPAEGRDDALARSAFSRIETARWDQTFARTLDELVGLQYSFSYSSPAVLGTRQAAFDELLRRELTAFSPSGVFENTVPIEAVIATRP